MNPADLVRLLSLAAIWGGSFLFMRIAAPILGPVLLIEIRVGLAALFLFAISRLRNRRLDVKANWKHYLVLGWFNSALPFLLFAFAARTLSASLLSVLNATAPIWGAIILAVVARTRLTTRRALGLGMGLSGVALLLGLDAMTLRPGALLAVLAALGAAVSYGIATTYAKSAKKIDAFCNAHGSMWAATALIAPAVPLLPAIPTSSEGVMTAVLALGVICSGVAYLLYFRLIADLGATSALTVTFLVPVFGILWGSLFLGEKVAWYTVAGSLIVMFGTALVTGFSPRSLVPSKAPVKA
jgi:drug/metabolite transporter (DMT)-like permease